MAMMAMYVYGIVNNCYDKVYSIFDDVQSEIILRGFLSPIKLTQD